MPQDQDYLEGIQSESSKAKIDVQKTRDSVSISEGHFNFPQKHESVKEGVLPSDEQEECYRQQNIEPPSNLQETHHSEKSSKEGTETAIAPIDDDHSKCKLQKPGLSAPEHVLSLYSHQENNVLTPESSEREHKEQNVNNQPHETDLHLGKGYDLEKKISRLENLENNEPQNVQGKRSPEKLNQRVYKPIQLEAEFPVYDEDIEVRPDPLHGILDDKYWENQEDKGSVIRKYVDLAINNMIPNGADIVKRDVDPVKCGFDERGERCHCNQIVACKDCKKEKQEEVQEEKSTTNLARSSTTKEKRSLSHGKVILDTNNPNREHFDRRLMSLDDKDDDGENNVNFNSYVTSYYSRKLLSLVDGDEDESVDEEVEDEQEKNINKNQKPYVIKSFNKNKGVYGDYEPLEDRMKDEYHPFRKEYISSVESFSSQSQMGKNTDFTRETSEAANYFISKNDHKYENSSSNRGIPNLENPSLYVPNKFANMMQKARKEKPPENVKPNPNLEFEAMEKQTFQNETLSPSNFYNDNSEKKGYQYNEKDSYFQKGRRSPEGTWPGFVFTPSGSSSNQGSDDIKLNSSMSTVANTTSSVRPITVEPLSTSTIQLSHPTLKKDRKSKIKASYEGTEDDAEIANDIVETVLIESQKDTLLGHNLGLYRRHESLKNVKYTKNVVPETEKIVTLIMHCIMEKIKDQLAKQSCEVLDPELLDFLKWLVLTGEPYKDYSRKEKEFSFGLNALSVSHVSKTCDPGKGSNCEPDDTAHVNFESTSISNSST